MTSFERTINSLSKVSITDYHSKMLASAEEFKGEYRGVSPCIALTTNYHFPENHESVNYYYSRSENPNYTFIESQMSILHNGSCSFAFATGMAAISAVIETCYRKKIIIYSNEIYNDVPKLLTWMKEENDVTILPVDITNTEEVIKTIKNIGVEKIGLFYCETASNPNSKIPDFIPLFSFIKEFDRSILIAIDNTFLSPSLFQPFNLPLLTLNLEKNDQNDQQIEKLHLVDIVIESGTKYLSGKGDVLLGIVCVRKNNQTKEDRIISAIKSRLDRWRSITGGSPSPFSCWLVSKGLETLPLRVKAQSKATVKVVKFLENLPFVTRVIHPSLQSHPYHSRIKYFCGGLSGSVFRFHVGSDILADESLFMKNIHPFIYAVSFGDSHTLFYPISGLSSPVFLEDNNNNNYIENSERKKYGTWFRVSIGLQSSSELIRNFLTIFLRNSQFYVEFANIKKFSFKKNISLLSFSSTKPQNYSMENRSNDIFFVLDPHFKFVVFIHFDEKISAKGSQIQTQLFVLDGGSDDISDGGLFLLQKSTPLYCFKNLSFKLLPTK